MEDEQLLKRISPDLVLSDFRFSMEVACKRQNIPLINLTNAHWLSSRHYQLPVPDSRLMAVGFTANDFIFRHFQSNITKKFLAPLNRFRQANELPVANSFQDAYCFGDHLACFDSKHLYPFLSSTRTHFLGPISGSFSGTLPAELLMRIDEPEESKLPLVYLSFGSSGANQHILKMIKSLSSNQWCLVATGKFADRPEWISKTVFVAPFIPQHLLARRASLFVTNGGTMSAYEALKFSVPVLGIPQNMDQLLFTDQICHLGLGFGMRSSQIDWSGLRQQVAQIMRDEDLKQRLQQLKSLMSTEDIGEQARILIRQHLSGEKSLKVA